jgi:hypothetical protein
MNNDVIVYICDFLSDVDKLAYLSINNNMHLLKINVIFHTNIHIDQIIHLKYYDRFTNIVAGDCSILPLNTKKLVLTNTYTENINNLIPLNVLYLTFKEEPIYDITENFPTNIIHANIENSKEIPHKNFPECLNLRLTRTKLIYGKEFDYNKAPRNRSHCIIGKNNSDIQHIILNIIKIQTSVPKLIIFGPDKNNSFYKSHYPDAIINNIEKYDDKIIKRLLFSMQLLIEKKKKNLEKKQYPPNIYVIFDLIDLNYCKSDAFIQLWMNCRCYLITPIVITQKYNYHPLLSNDTVEYIYLLTENNSDDLYEIWTHHFNNVCTFDIFSRYYTHIATNNGYIVYMHCINPIFFYKLPEIDKN